MMLKYVSTSTLAAGAAAAAILFGSPAATAEPAQDCTTVEAGQVCDDTSRSAVPPAPGPVDNGPYGPAGETPPVGGDE